MTEGRIGEWTTVPVQLPPAPSSSLSNEPTPAPASAPASPAAPEPVEDVDDLNGWRFKRRRVAVGLGEIYDPGIIEVKKKEEGIFPEHKAEEDPASSQATEMPKWTPRGWLRPGEAPPNADTLDGNITPDKSDTERPAKTEQESIDPPDESVQRPKAEPLSPAVKVEEPEVGKSDSAPEPSSAGLFRKRKASAPGAGKRGVRR